MKLWATAALALLFSVAAAHADDLQKAFDAVGATLQKDGGGLVPLYAACPKKNADPWLYVGSSVVVFFSETDRAILVNAGLCNGGNGSAQYLVIIENGVATLADVGLKDMSFLANNMYAEGNTLSLYGNRWLNNDPHCCPSKKAILEYNVKTHQRKLTIVGDDKP